MSKQQHPNINAVDLAVDIMKGIEKYIRGNAKDSIDQVKEAIADDVKAFVNDISDTLDDKFGTAIKGEYEGNTEVLTLEIVNPSFKCYLKTADIEASAYLIVVIGEGKLALSGENGEMIFPMLMFTNPDDWNDIWNEKFGHPIKEFVDDPERHQRLADVCDTMTYDKNHSSLNEMAITIQEFGERQRDKAEGLKWECTECGHTDYPSKWEYKDLEEEGGIQAKSVPHCPNCGVKCDDNNIIGRRGKK